MDKLAEPLHPNGRTHKGYSVFHLDNQRLFDMVVRGVFSISRLRGRGLRHKLGKTTTQISQGLKRLRLRGGIKRIGPTYEYDLTCFGRFVMLMELKPNEPRTIQTLAHP